VNKRSEEKRENEKVCFVIGCPCSGGTSHMNIAFWTCFGKNDNMDVVAHGLLRGFILVVFLRVGTLDTPFGHGIYFGYTYKQETTMITRVQKWGNSQGLRFPKDILEQASLSIGEDVDVRVRDGEIVIKAVNRIRGRHRLSDLVARMPKTKNTQKDEWGKPSGKEVW
jgi:antitoxin MazE